MKERDEIEDLFASSFGDFEETPPEALKSNLDAKLFPNNAVSSSKKWNWKWLLVFIPVIGLSAITFYKLQANTTSKSDKISAAVSSKNEYHKSSKDSNKPYKTAKLNNSKNTKNNSLTERNKPNQKSNIQKDNDRRFKKNNLKSIENLDIKPKSNNKARMKENPMTFSLTKTTKERNSTSSLQSENSNKITISNSENKANKQPKTQNSENEINSNSFIEVSANSIAKSELVEQNAINNQTSTIENKIESTISKTENNTGQNTTNDSIKTTTEITKEKTDSSKIASTKINEVLNEIKKDNTQKNKPLWSIYFYGGIANGLNFINPTSTLLKEKIGTNFSIEANYGFHPKMSLSAGLGLELRSEIYSKEFINIDSVITNYTVTYITDSMNNIIDSIVTNFYENDTTLLTENQTISYTVFSFPIYFNYTFFSKNNWSGAIGAGIRLNYFKTTINSTSANFASPTLSNIGLQLQLRPQLTYNWTKVGIGVYGNFGYDAIQATSWTDFTRKRYNYGVGILVKYRF